MATPADPLAGASTSTVKALEQMLSDGSNSRAHEFSREIRRRNAVRGRQTAEARLDAADIRDAIAHARDLAATTRDDGTDALGLRRAGAADREQAARERLHALVDREILADELAIADNDPLTGARTRAAGLTDLRREVDRCTRTGCELVVAYVDVVGLKHLNDSQGHEAGDALLAGAVRAMKDHLRPYDLVVRIGGDEFLCAMSGMTPADARARFAVIASAVASAPVSAAIRTGFAALEHGDGVTDLIARADGEMIEGDHAGHESRTTASAGGMRMRPRERVAASASSVAPLRRAVDEFASGSGASEAQRQDIAIAISEALSNGVVHAGAGDAQPGTVGIEAWMAQRTLNVVVSDEGAGSRARAGSPGLGLGLAVIVRLARSVEIEETLHAMRVRMTFAIG
jgi:diguanylate cyclase (GGDEF)-like protein